MKGGFQREPGRDNYHPGWVIREIADILKKELNEVPFRIMSRPSKKRRAEKLPEAEKQQSEPTLYIPAKKLTKRNILEIDFQAQHWWGDGRIFRRFKKGGQIQRQMNVDEAKAALIYEAMRRHPDVQQAWINCDSASLTDGWQEFASLTANYLPYSWDMLEFITKETFLDLMHSPWFVPPKGYSTFPDKSKVLECEKATLQKIPQLPAASYSLKPFVDYLRRFEEAGFIFVAIDHKSRHRDSYAINALRKLLAHLPPTCRKQDIELHLEHHLPPGIFDAEKLTLEEKQRNGAIKQKDLEDFYDKYTKPTRGLMIPWHEVATIREKQSGKRTRRTKKSSALVDEMRFDFPKLFAELADLDNGKRENSDFIARLRL